MPVVIVIMNVATQFGVVTVIVNPLGSKYQFHQIQVLTADGFVAIVGRNDDLVVCSLPLEDRSDVLQQGEDLVVDFRPARQFF